MCPSETYAEYKKISYSMNCVLGHKKQSAIHDTSSVILLIDEDDYINDGLFSVRNGISSDALTSVHNGFGNLLFVDGHVKAYKANSNEIFKPYSQTRESVVTGSPRFMEPYFDVTATGCPQS
jgi:prepilin-type processing-associated H-X9-DG protein